MRAIEANATPRSSLLHRYVLPRVYSDYVVCPQLLDDRSPVTGRINLPEAFENGNGSEALRALGITAQWTGETLNLCTSAGRSGGFLPPLSAYSLGSVATPTQSPATFEPQQSLSRKAIEPVEPAKPPVTEIVRLKHLQTANAAEMAQGLCQALSGCSVVQVTGQPVLAVRGASEDVSAVIGLLEQVDLPQRSYRLRATLFEVDTSQGHALGIEGQLGTSVFARLEAGTAGSVSLGVDYSGASLAIRAQEDTGRATVLSRPELRLSDGEPATFASSVEVPTVSQILYDEAGRQTQGIEYREAGLILNVTLRASGESVELDLGQELSSFGQRSSLAGNPSKTKRSLKSKFNLPLGEPILIGGLIRDSSDHGEGRLPFLGWRTRQSDQVTRTQVFLLVQVDQLAEPAAGEGPDTGARPQDGNGGGSSPASSTVP